MSEGVYTKQVQIRDCTLVVGEVFAPDGRRTAVKFMVVWDWFGFGCSHRAVARKARKMHAWCDAWINMCSQQECSARRSTQGVAA